MNRRPALPHEILPPHGAERWGEMYSWYHQFQEFRSEEDSKLFWFQDGLHAPRVIYPYDTIVAECWWHSFATRYFAIPGAAGIDQRILHGYLYLAFTDNPTSNATTLIESSKSRIGSYSEEWESSYEEWKARIEERIRYMESLVFEPLPEKEDERVVRQRKGLTSGYMMIQSFEGLVLALREVYQYHFELLTVAQSIQADFLKFCRKALPHEQSQSLVATLLEGDELAVHRPDQRLRELAILANDRGLGRIISQYSSIDDLYLLLNRTSAGKEWLAEWNRSVDELFMVSVDPGHPGVSHIYGTWQDDLTIPMNLVIRYIGLLHSNHTLDTGRAQRLTRRDQITNAVRIKIPQADRADFDDHIEIGRKCTNFIDEHMWYVEHRATAAFWKKSKSLAESLTVMGVFEEPEDMFVLRVDEVLQVALDVVARWSVGSSLSSKTYWMPTVSDRRRILSKLQSRAPVPAIGQIPADAHPALAARWGITSYTISQWQEEQRPTSGTGKISGTGASPGIVEGTIRVINNPLELTSLQYGEILVCRMTAPTWSAVFAKVSGVVTDSGGMLCHAAVLCREYEIPAVVGTGNASRVLQNGQVIRIDGTSGHIIILGQDIDL
jgi:pyruvate,water dikinase